MRSEAGAAMLKSGGAAVASGLLSAIATKIIAAMLGPSYVALLQTLQQTRQAAVTAATLNGQTALVQGAASRERRDYVRTVVWMIAGATATVAVFFVAAPGVVARWCGLPVRFVALLALPVVLTSATTVLGALLNAAGRIGRLAMVQTAGPAAMAVVAWPVAVAVRGGWTGAMVVAIGIAAAASLVVAGWGVRVRIASLPACAACAKTFLAISGGMLATGLLGSLVLLGIRAGITRAQGVEVTGQFDAAWNISMNHVTLALASLQTYYLPSLVRGEDRAAQIGRVLRAATLVATPVIVGIALLKPLVLGIFYSPAFYPAAVYLRWTLLGDYLKVGSWVLSVPMLAAADMRAFLVADLTALAAFFGSAWILSLVRTAAEAAALAFVVCYAVHFAVCWTYARRRYGFRLGVAWPAGLAMVAAVVWR